MKRAPLLFAALLLTACARPDTPQVQGPLAIDIPELCTVCVEVLRCEGPQGRTAYVMAEKGKWAQIATIWDYFIAFFRPKTEDFRELATYSLDASGERATAVQRGLEARLDVWNRRVEVPGAVIVQKSGEWLDAAGQPQGQCTLLPRGADRPYAAKLEESLK
jgi:hypothetical protein